MWPEWNPRELELLAGTFLFQGLERETVRRAAQDPLCTREDYLRGDVIYSPGHFRRSLGVLLEGRARVTKGELVVSTLERGDLFGAAALYNRRTRYETTITALEDCAAAFFPQELVSRLMAESPAACANYIRYLSERIHFLNRKIEGLTWPGAVGKLARYLLSEGGEGGAVTCAATELAQRLDVSRASLYRAFEVLEGAGAIRRMGKLVQTADREALLRQSQA